MWIFVENSPTFTCQCPTPLVTLDNAHFLLNSVVTRLGVHERDSCPGHLKNFCFFINKLQSHYRIILPTAWLNILLNLWGWYRCKLSQIVSDPEVNIFLFTDCSDSAFRQILARSKWMCCLCKNNVNEV